MRWLVCLLRFCVIGSCLITPLAVQQVRAENIAVWSYQAATGPAHWAEIKSGNILCRAGKQQSPIALNSDQAAHPLVKEFALAYQTPVMVTPLKSGLTTLQAKVTSGINQVIFKGQAYRLMQFHFHTPSEHKLDNKRYPMELHLVHKDAEDKLTVVGILIQQGQENKLLAPVFAGLADQSEWGEQAAAKQIKIDLAALLPRQKKAMVYVGSLTTPPCSEHVNWIVLEQPIELSARQIAMFKAVFHDNHRPLQKKNHRAISEE